jgi:hypothetical protein
MAGEKDEWSERIAAVHPTLTGDHATYAKAMEMVGNRHSKGALVELVNWLLLGEPSLTREAETKIEMIAMLETVWNCTRADPLGFDASLFDEVRRERATKQELIKAGWVQIVPHPHIRHPRGGKPIDTLVITDSGRTALRERSTGLPNLSASRPRSRATSTSARNTGRQP